MNKALLIGRLGRDPETRYTGSGQAISRLRQTKPTKTATGNAKRAPNGTRSLFGGKPLSARRNTCTKARSFSSRGKFSPASGRTEKARSGPLSRLSRRTSARWTGSRAAMEPELQATRQRKRAQPMTTFRFEDEEILNFKVVRGGTGDGTANHGRGTDGTCSCSAARQGI